MYFRCPSVVVVVILLPAPPLCADTSQFTRADTTPTSATCRRQGKMSPILAPSGQFWRHIFYCVGTLLCRVIPTQTDQRQTTKMRALSNSHVAACQPKKRAPKSTTNNTSRTPPPIAASPIVPPPSPCPRRHHRRCHAAATIDPAAVLLDIAVVVVVVVVVCRHRDST